MFAQDNHSFVLLLSNSDDEYASQTIANTLASSLAKQFSVERIAIDNSTSVRSVLEHRSAESGVTAAVICASDSSLAATLVGNLVDRGGARPWFVARVIVVLGDAKGLDALRKGLDALPKWLLDKLELIAFDVEDPSGVLERLDAIARAPRSVDLLASVFRSAIAQRSPDLLLAITDAHSGVVELDERTLTSTARVGDGGRSPNPLWSRWAGFGRELSTVQTRTNKRTKKA